MPPKVKVTKEMVMQASFEVIRTYGHENLSARTIAEYLGCSTQPVLYSFKTVDEIREAAYDIADRYHTDFIMPKETDEEKAARKKAIADGTLEATKVPLSVMQMGMEGLKLADKLYGHFNKNCASDLGVGVLNFLAGIRGAWMNVKINLPGVKDEAFAAEAEAEGRKILAEGEEIANRLYKAIEEEL